MLALSLFAVPNSPDIFILEGLEPGSSTMTTRGNSHSCALRVNVPYLSKLLLQLRNKKKLFTFKSKFSMPVASLKGDILILLLGNERRALISPAFSLI